MNTISVSGTGPVMMNLNSNQFHFLSESNRNIDFDMLNENVLGNVGQGFKIALSGLDGGRLNIASCSLGGAAKCLDIATDYIKGRKQFGRPLADNQHL
jgi:alkylation response protein AidB-like acyl-CoA dehydrogenase